MSKPNFGGGKGKRNKTNEKGSGRVGRLDEQTLGYYRRVSEALKEEFEQEEDKELLLNNVFTQLSKEALKVSQNQTVSAIVEGLLKEANKHHVTKVFNAFSRDWELACTDRFACYVTQTLVARAGQNLSAKEEEEDFNGEEEEQELRPVGELVKEVYAFLMGNLTLFMQHTYASHIIRTVLETLAGVKVTESVIRSKVSRVQHRGKELASTPVPKPAAEYQELFWKMATTIVSLKMLKDHAQNFLSNPVLQTVLLVSKSLDETKHVEVCQLLIDRTGLFETTGNADGTSLPDMIVHQIGSHLVEQVIAVATSSMYAKIIEDLKSHLVDMAINPMANYVLQRLISHSHTQEQFESVFKSLVPHFEDVLAQGHAGVILQLAKGCLKHGTKQEKLIKALLKAFHCYKPVERQLKCIQVLASMTTYDVFYKIPDSDEEEDSKDKTEEDSDDVTVPTLTQVHLHGSLLLQTLLQFGNPKVLVTSLLDLRPVELYNMATDPSGTYILEAFLKSETVGEKSREKLYNKMKGKFVEMSCNKHGSRTMDAMWKKASLKQRVLIAEALGKKEGRVSGDIYGRFIWRNLAMKHFLSRPKEWKEVQSGNVKKRKLFSDIFEDKEKEGPPGKKEKVEQKEEESEDEDEENLILKDDEDDTQGTKVLDMFSKPKKAIPDSGQNAKKKNGKHNASGDNVTAESSSVVSDKKKKKRKQKDSTDTESANTEMKEKKVADVSETLDTTIELKKKKKKKHKKSVQIAT